MQCEKPSRVHGDGIQKQNEKSKGICVNFSLRMVQELAGGKGQQQQEAGLQCAISRLQTRNRKGSSSGRRGDNNFFIDKEKNCRATIFIEYFCPQSRYTQATVYGSCMYVCVGLCVWLASILSMSEVCAKGYKTVYTATTRAGHPAGSPPHKILLTPIFVQLFSNNFVMRFACHAPSSHKSWLGCHKCLHFGSCCCAAKVFLAQVAQFPLDSPPFPPLSQCFSCWFIGLI